MKPKLVIEGLDNLSDGVRSGEDATEGDYLMDLQRRIAGMYEVLPYTGARAWYEVEFEDGKTSRINFVVFGYTTKINKGENRLAVVRELCYALWGDLRRAWPQGSVVMWRRWPHADAEEERCEHCGAPTGKEIVKVTVRLGSTAPLSGDVLAVQDGMFLPKLGSTK